MEVYFNEKSLDDSNQLLNVLKFINDSIEPLKHHRIKVLTKLTEFNIWFIKQSVNDLTLRNYFAETLRLFEDCDVNKFQSYYHHFRHQDFHLSVGDNISESSIAIAANKVLNQKEAVILNYPGSFYCERPHIPILKTSYDSTKMDELVNIPCYNESVSIRLNTFLHERIKNYVNDSRLFEDFSKEYIEFTNNFDLKSWKPRTFNNNSVLSSCHVFPSTTRENIKAVLLVLDSKRQEKGNNAAKYIEIGSTVLEIHGYKKNHKISSFYHHEIFEGGTSNNRLFISIDEENGALEVIDYTGTHIGVYGYDGRWLRCYKKQVDIDNHSLKDLKALLNH